MGSPILKHELVSGALIQTLRATPGVSVSLWLCHSLWALLAQCLEYSVRVFKSISVNQCLFVGSWTTGYLYLTDTALIVLRESVCFCIVYSRIIDNSTTLKIVPYY